MSHDSTTRTTCHSLSTPESRVDKHRYFLSQHRSTFHAPLFTRKIREPEGHGSAGITSFSNGNGKELQPPEGKYTSNTVEPNQPELPFQFSIRDIDIDQRQISSGHTFKNLLQYQHGFSGTSRQQGGYRKYRASRDYRTTG